MNSLTFNPSAGTSIHSAATESTRLAKRSGRCVRFNFNDVSLVAAPKKSAQTLLWEFWFNMNRQAAAYRQTEKYRQQQESRQREVHATNYEIRRLLLLLPWSLEHGLNTTIDWLYRFTRIADDIAAEFNAFDLCATLEAAGYVANEYVGQPPEFFNTRENMGRYIIGQAIACLKQGMPPHPVCISFCEKYFRQAIEAK